jgi:hypothetical protein
MRAKREATRCDDATKDGELRVIESRAMPRKAASRKHFCMTGDDRKSHEKVVCIRAHGELRATSRGKCIAAKCSATVPPFAIGRST